MGLDDSCNAGLVLGLSLTPSSNNIAKKSLTLNLDDGNYHDSPCFDAPSLTLSLSGDSFSRKTEETTFTAAVAAAGDPLCQQQASSHSGVSSFSVKREREMGLEEAETERVSSRAISDDHEDEDGVSPRKKLRLTKEQSALLEESFKQHSSLNPKQKQVLARQLNLRPRQVEVWFQNRRARTKLKQTEVDYEFLKKCCENLTDENRRLQKEVEELKALKLARPFYMHMPAATLAICPSCERIGAGNGDGAAVKTLTFSISAKSHFFNPFANPSAAC